MDRGRQQLSEVVLDQPGTNSSASSISTNSSSAEHNHSSVDTMLGDGVSVVDIKRQRFPYCVVWTPLPCLTWLFPLIGHMGICTSNGVIRDFQGPYSVGEGCMAFGQPVKYWQLDPLRIGNPSVSWDRAVIDSCEEYKKRMHILCWDNCHSHVAYALNIMRYNHSTSWNMVNLAVLTPINSRYISWCAVIQTWAPFLVILAIVLIITFSMIYT